jgi:hypothetical protein
MCKKYCTARKAAGDNTGHTQKNGAVSKVNKKWNRTILLCMPCIIQSMRFACWKSTATKTHSEYVILNGFPTQQRLRERAWMWRYTYTACLVKTFFRTTIPGILWMLFIHNCYCTTTLSSPRKENILPVIMLKFLQLNSQYLFSILQIIMYCL